MHSDGITTTTSAQRDLLACLAVYALANGDAAHTLRIVDELLATAVGCTSEADTPAMALLRAQALARLGRAREAEATIRAVLAGPNVWIFRPQLWRTYAALGNLLTQQGDLAGASQQYGQAEVELATLADLLPDPVLRDTFLRRGRAGMPSAMSKRSSRSPARERGELTRREHEVAHLVSQGLSNRKIAATLTVSERTVEDHVSNILAKLGFASRSRIAAWVASQTGATQRQA
jgi:DNA-binding CsgD family transcriptional regulator